MTLSNMPQNSEHQALADDIKQLIEAAKQRTIVKVNAELSLLYWHVGFRINEQILGGERTQYGKQVIVALSKQLTESFGKGWSKSNLAQMVKFVQFFPDLEIVQTLSGQLSWRHSGHHVSGDQSWIFMGTLAEPRSVSSQSLNSK